MREDLKADWLEFHEKNPHVYKLFERFSLEVAAVRERYSAKAIIERMRWHYNFEINGDYEFKLTNTHTAYYARHFLENHPDLEGFFVLKERIEDTHQYQTNEDGQHAFF